MQFDDLVEEIDEYFRNGITVQPGDVVFDVGANIGAFALVAAQRAGGPLDFYCFEPIPPVYQALEKNFSTNALLQSCSSHLYKEGLTAIGAQDQAEFHYFKRLPCDTTQHIDEKRAEFAAFFTAKGESLRASMMNKLPSWLGKTLGTLIGSFVARFPSSGLTRTVFELGIGATKVRCPLETIESVIRREGVKQVDLLKVDVEGAELEVLQGLGSDSWPLVRQVVLEGHDKDGRLEAIKTLLKKNGFSQITCEVPPLAVERKLNNFILHARRAA